MVKLAVTMAALCFVASSLCFADPPGHAHGVQFRFHPHNQANILDLESVQFLGVPGNMPPGLQKREGSLPPGLEKKGKIPPGWSKGQKRGWGNHSDLPSTTEVIRDLLDIDHGHD